MPKKKEETVEVPVAWFKRLVELRKLALKQDKFESRIDHINVLLGYIESAENIIK